MGEYICPNCKQPIYDDEALLCHFCGESLKRPAGGTMGKMKYGNNRVFWFFILFLAIFGFLLMVIR